MLRLKALLSLSICVFACFAYVRSAYVISYLNEKDIAALRSAFQAASTNPSDVANAFYGTAGLVLLGDKISDSQKLCALAKKHEADIDIETVFHSTGLAGLLENCKLANPKAVEALQAALTGDRTTQDLYYISSALKYLGHQVSQTKLNSALAASLKKNDSISNLGYAFHAAMFLEGKPASSVFDRIEDCVAQADEVDGKYLQFEGGLSVSAIAISGIYSLAEHVKAAPNLKADEAVKLVNYLLSRKGVPLVRPAYHLLKALHVFTTNHHHIPVAFTLASPLALSHSQKIVRVKVCDVLGHSVGDLSVSVEKGTHVPTSGVVVSKKPLTLAKDDKSKTLFEFNFLDTPREKGFYLLSLSAASTTDKRLVGTQGAEISVKVTTEITVDNVEIAALDREQTGMGTSPHKIAGFSKLGSVLEADIHQKILLKFSVKDKNTNEPTKVHQAFVIFTHLKSNQEIVFVAEPDTTKVYKFDADLQKSVKDFDYLSGKYSIKLVLGDAVVNNAINWVLADINLKFPEQAPGDKKSNVGDITYNKRPEIQHMFRQPEKRPAQIVSDTFTALVLLPLLILLIIWLRIGINISNFPFSLYSLGFHLGVLAIFGLYLLFWLQLNMFQTLQYLALIGAFTFFCGNAMLRRMADSRKPKSE